MTKSETEQVQLQSVEINPPGPTGDLSVEFSKLTAHTSSMNPAQTYHVTVAGTVSRDTGSQTLRTKPVDLPSQSGGWRHRSPKHFVDREPRLVVS